MKIRLSSTDETKALPPGTYELEGTTTYAVWITKITRSLLVRNDAEGVPTVVDGPAALHLADREETLVALPCRLEDVPLVVAAVMPGRIREALAGIVTTTAKAVSK